MSTGFNVKINNLIKVFNNNKVVLNNISLNVHSGESIVILGESGVGKSVFMRIVGMLLNPTSGSIKIHNQETIGISNVDRNKLMEKVGFLFQYSGLFEHLTNWENVAFRKLFILKQNRKKCKEEAIEMLTRLEADILKSFGQQDLSPLTDTDRYKKLVDEYESDVQLRVGGDSWFTKYCDQNVYWILKDRDIKVYQLKPEYAFGGGILESVTDIEERLKKHQ